MFKIVSLAGCEEVAGAVPALADEVDAAVALGTDDPWMFSGFKALAAETPPLALELLAGPSEPFSWSEEEPDLDMAVDIGVVLEPYSPCFIRFDRAESLLLLLFLASGRTHSQPKVMQFVQGMWISASHRTFLERHTAQARDPRGLLYLMVKAFGFSFDLSAATTGSFCEAADSVSVLEDPIGGSSTLTSG